MKTLGSFAIAMLLCVAAAGCGMVGTGVAPAFPDNSSQSDDGMRFVTPVTGGAMIMATPIGGNMYEPITGGPPIMGS